MTTFTGEVICTDSYGEHKMVYEHWGDPNNPHTLVCIHGLTRNRHDFDFLAAHLQENYRIICPDLPGRGDSDWLLNPIDYSFALYVEDILTLIKELNLNNLTLLGTSMGGIIGMSLAGLPNSPIRSLILNDVGAHIPRSGLDRIRKRLVVDTLPRFPDLTKAEQYFREEQGRFGELSDQHWQHLTRHGVRLTEKGDYLLAYDPSIALPFQGVIEEINLWEVWQTVHCPTLLIRGENSDLLLPQTVIQMQSTHPTMEVITFKGVGHAPLFMVSEQIQSVETWLSRING